MCTYGDVQVEVYVDEQECAEAAAAAIVQAAATKPDLLMCLATGSSPTLTYSLLAEHHHSGGSNGSSNGASPLSAVRVLKLDEWYGVAHNSNVTCEKYLRKHVLGPLGIPCADPDEKAGARNQQDLQNWPCRYVGFRSDAADPKAECGRLDRLLREVGWTDALGKGIDVAVLGLGVNGHLGFNEPAEEPTSAPHCAELERSTQQHPMLDAAEGGNSAPTHGLTLGVDHLLQSREVILLVTGAHKVV
jgi:galactosamine-6-phosphate isomerase